MHGSAVNHSHGSAVNHSHRIGGSLGAPPRAFRARLARALLIASLAVAASASAEQTPQPAEPAGAAKILEIPLVEVSRRAEQTALLLNKASEAFDAAPTVAKIAQQIPEAEKSLGERRQLLARALATGGNRTRLVDAMTDWDHALSELKSWSKAIAPGLQRTESAIQALSTEREIWDLTRRNALEVDAPQSIVNRIQTTLSEIDAAIATARDTQSSLLTLQDRIVQQDLFATAALDQIRSAQREGRSNLFERDAPILWRDLLDIDPDEHLDDVRMSVTQDMRTLREYAADTGSRFLLDLLVFIVVLRYAFAVKRRLAHPTEGVPPIGRSGELFERPVAITLLASVLIARLIHGVAPIGFSALISLALVVPLVRLVPLLLPTNMRWIPWLMAVFVVLSRVRRIANEAPLAEACLFGLESIAMIATLLWLMRPARLRKIDIHTQLPRLLGAGMRATLFLLSASIIASALGYRSLGLLVGTASMTSVYLAMILFAAARAAEAAMEASFHTAPARKLSFVRRRRDAVLRTTGRYAAVAAMLYWGFLTLQFFELLEPARAAMRSILDADLKLGELDISIGDVLAFVLTIVVAFLSSRLIRFFLEEEVFPRMRLRRGVGNAVATLLQYAMLLIGFSLALSAAGMDFSRLALFAGAFGVGLGFGLQTVINNFVSGLILLFERPIQIGDMVEVGGLLGEVRRIGARSSTVRTADGAEVIIPNANLIAEQVVNWTLSDRQRRLSVDVGVAYGTDPAIVLELLRGVGHANPSVLDDPAPEALFLGFGDSALNFRLRVWVPRFEESFAISSELGVAISAALRDAEIQIPFPQRDLHVRSIGADVIRALDGPRQP